MPVTNIYPRLSELLPLEKIPNEIDALRDALENVFDKMDQLQYSKPVKADTLDI